MGELHAPPPTGGAVQSPVYRDCPPEATGRRCSDRRGCSGWPDGEGPSHPAGAPYMPITSPANLSWAGGLNRDCQLPWSSPSA